MLTLLILITVPLSIPIPYPLKEVLVVSADYDIVPVSVTPPPLSIERSAGVDAYTDIVPVGGGQEECGPQEAAPVCCPNLPRGIMA